MIIKHGRHICLWNSRDAQRYVSFFFFNLDSAFRVQANSDHWIGSRVKRQTLTFQRFHCYCGLRKLPGICLVVCLCSHWSTKLWTALECFTALVARTKTQYSYSLSFDDLAKGPWTQYFTKNQTMFRKLPIAVVRKVAALFQETAVGINLTFKCNTLVSFWDNKSLYTTVCLSPNTYSTNMHA